MHEMSITASILRIVRREMKKSGVKRLKSLKLKVGELTAVEPQALRFCFDASTKGTPLEGSSLEIIEVPLTGKCVCGTEFKIEEFMNICPRCGGDKIKRVAGSELEIVSMDAI